MNRKKLIRTADSPSLWNCTLAPGWTQEDLEILRLAIMKFGLGAWSKIVASNCLPGKNPSQLNLQTQRMLGQQSLGEFMGIHLDARDVWEHNSKKEGLRKNGCLINTGNNPTKEERQRKIEENKKKWGLAQDQIESVVLPVREIQKDDSTIRAENRTKLFRLKEIYKMMEERLFSLWKARGANMSEIYNEFWKQAEGIPSSLHELLANLPKEPPKPTTVTTKKPPVTRKPKRKVAVHEFDSDESIEIKDSDSEPPLEKRKNIPRASKMADKIFDGFEYDEDDDFEMPIKGPISISSDDEEEMNFELEEDSDFDYSSAPKKKRKIQVGKKAVK